MHPPPSHPPPFYYLPALLGIWDDTTWTLKGNCSSLGPSTSQQLSYTYPGISYTYTCRPGFECRCTNSGLADAACTFLDNPNYGATSFDSYPWAMVTLFQSITLEGWVDVMYQLQDGTSGTPMHMHVCSKQAAHSRRQPHTRSLSQASKQHSRQASKRTAAAHTSSHLTTL